MRVSKIFFYLTMVCLSISCSDLVGRRMQTHKRKPFDATNIPVSLKGIYFKLYPTDGHYCRPPWAFYLYADGTVIGSTMSGMSQEMPELKFWSDPDRFLKTMKSWDTFSTNQGHYFIENDSITIELTDIMPSTPFRNFIRFHGTISSESILYFDSKLDTWCESDKESRKVTSFDKVYYKLYKTDVKPDSSKVWFKGSSWYENNVWYNQRSSSRSN